MFDIGFWELALIAVVALLVVGPERLPALARTVGLWVGRIRRYVSTVRDDIEREIRAEELKEMLEETKDAGGLADVVTETESTLSAAREELEKVEKEAETTTREGLEPGLDSTGAPDETISPQSGDGDAADPGSAATAVGEAVNARSDEIADEATAEADRSTGADEVEGDERRSR